MGPLPEIWGGKKVFRSPQNDFNFGSFFWKKCLYWQEKKNLKYKCLPPPPPPERIKNGKIIKIGIRLKPLYPSSGWGGNKLGEIGGIQGFSVLPKFISPKTEKKMLEKSKPKEKGGPPKIIWARVFLGKEKEKNREKEMGVYPEFAFG